MSAKKSAKALVTKLVSCDIDLMDFKDKTHWELGSQNLHDEDLIIISDVLLRANVIHLDLSFNNFTDVSCLVGKCAGLETLWIHGNIITDMNCLQDSFPDLVTLNIWDNSLTEIDFLKSIPKLTWLDAGFNNIPTVKKDEFSGYLASKGQKMNILYM